MRILPAMTVLAALALPLAAHAKDLTPIESVKVETDVTAISNPAAARFWGRLSEDLTAAILSRVQPRIAHLEQVSLQDGVCTKRQLARGLLRVQPMARLEPLAVFVDQADQ